MLYIIEDDADVLGLFKDLFEFEGFLVCACSTYEEALDSMPSNPAALLLSDYHIPESRIDFGEFLVQARNLCPVVPCIVVSGNAQARDEITSSGLEVQAFMLKPPDLDRLKGMVCHLHKGARVA